MSLLLLCVSLWRLSVIIRQLAATERHKPGITHAANSALIAASDQVYSLNVRESHQMKDDNVYASASNCRENISGHKHCEIQTLTSLQRKEIVFMSPKLF